MVKHLVLGGSLEHHKGKFPPLCQHQRKDRALAPGDLHEARQTKNHQRLEGDEARHHGGHGPGRLEDDAKVNAHAHGHEEQAQQQTLEGFDIGFQLAAVLAVCQQHTGQKRAQRHGQAHLRHQHGNAHDQK